MVEPGTVIGHGERNIPRPEVGRPHRRVASGDDVLDRGPDRGPLDQDAGDPLAADASSVKRPSAPGLRRGEELAPGSARPGLQQAYTRAGRPPLRSGGPRARATDPSRAPRRSRRPGRVPRRRADPRCRGYGPRRQYRRGRAGSCTTSVLSGGKTEAGSEAIGDRHHEWGEPLLSSDRLAAPSIGPVGYGRRSRRRRRSSLGRSPAVIRRRCRRLSVTYSFAPATGRLSGSTTRPANGTGLASSSAFGAAASATTGFAVATVAGRWRSPSASHHRPTRPRVPPRTLPRRQPAVRPRPISAWS